jgi:hypothetical protein
MHQINQIDGLLLALTAFESTKFAHCRWAGQESRWIASPFLSPVLAADGVARLRNASHGKSSAAPTGRPQVVYMRNQKVASTMLDEQTLEYAGAKVSTTRPNKKFYHCSWLFLFIFDPSVMQTPLL